MNKYARVCVAVIALAGLVWFIGNVAYQHRAMVTYMYTGDCIQQLDFIDEAMFYLVTGDCINGSYRSLFETDDREPPVEIRPEHTVSDLIREALRRDLLEGKDVCDMRGDRQPYLVFPVPALVVFDDSLQPPVPIVMCPPGAHRKYGTNVLYSNGDVKTLTLEEAEKLVAEQHPMPLKLKRTKDERESEPGNEEAENSLKRPGAE